MKVNRYYFYLKKVKNGILRIFFCWTFPLFLKGAKHKLNKYDLKSPSIENDSKILGDKLETLWKLEIDNNEKKPSIISALWKMFRNEIIFYGFLQLILEMILKLSQPLAIWKLMNTYRIDVATDPNDAYYAAGVIILAAILNVFLTHTTTFGLLHIGLKMRIACSSLVYRKSLKLNFKNTNESTTGLGVNILSNDMNRIDKCLAYIHYLWLAPLQTLSIIVLLGYVFDITSLTGCGVFLISISFQIYIGRFWSEFRSKTASKTDERVHLLNEIISGIQVIKMYTWEGIFIKLMEVARREEIRYIQYTSILRAIYSSLNKFTARLAAFISILVYILTGHQINARYVFVLKSFYTIFKDSMITLLPLGISSLAEAIASFRRVEKFLLIDERIPTKPPMIIQEKPQIKFDNITAKWSNIETLTNINVTINCRDLVAIIGPVGSGKTSFLNVILDELPIIKGRKLVIGVISIATQEPWLFAGTIRQNIVFGEEFNARRYNEILKICCLEQDLLLLPNGDQTVIDCVNLSGGQKARISLARCVYKKADIYLLDDPLSAMDTIVSREIFDECICKFLCDKCCVFVTHQLHYLKKIEKIYCFKNGKIEFYGNFDEIKNSVEEFSNLLVNYEHEDDDYILNELKHQKSNQLENSVNDDTNEEFAEEGRVKFAVYWKYFTTNGYCCFFLVMVLCGFTQIMASFCDFFESYWINYEEDRATNATHDQSVLSAPDASLYIYVSLILAIIFLTTIRSIFFFVYFVQVAQCLYKKMFNSIVKTGMLFFHQNPSGRILNRFCEDIGNIDETLPLLLMDSLQIGLNVIAINTVIALVNPWFIIVAIIMLVLFYFIRMLYLATSRDLKRIEATCRSPIFSHFNGTIRGLTTIRAFNVEYLFNTAFDNYLNQYTTAYFMSLSSQATFGFWLDLLCAFYIVIVTTSSFWGEDQRGASIGLAITQAFGLTGMFQWGMKQWSNLENQMISVERVLEYQNLPSEHDGDNASNEDNEAISIPNDWPKYCDIEFETIYLKYRPELDQSFVLMNINFKISPFEKVGVIGRTGAGKTSLISAIFRLIDYQGTISIDGIDIKQIPLERLRSKITIIPQEPILFTGTIRQNLDPFNQYNDLKIWQILDELELKEFIQQFPDGLNTKIIGKGSNLSLGQRQLLCLVRALLSNNNILILDEPTANVDFKTDVLIQNIIRKKTENSTVLIIAHRLHTIMDCDKVLVMDAGRIIEFGHPYELLQNPDGALNEFVLKTGKIRANHLKQIAEMNFVKNR